MVSVITLGCRLNFAESARMEQLAHEAGLRDITIINSCAVTSEAERQTRQTLRRQQREHPERLIALTGCAAEISPHSYARMKETGILIGNREKLYPAVWRRLARLRGADKNPPAPLPVEKTPKKVRAFLPVQQGCDHACTFCVIPQGRGGAVSLPFEDILQNARELMKNGARELCLTGVDIASYGTETGRSQLGWLVERLLHHLPELPCLRLSSLDPAIEDEMLERLFAANSGQKRLMPHLHLSLQSGSAMILKRMRRRHSPEQSLALIERLRRHNPAIGFGADLIAGFPTESAAHFDETLDFLRRAKLAFFHVFPYTPRPNTPAARMPQLNGSIIRARAKTLRELGQAQTQAFLAHQCGSKQMILVESPHQGRLPSYAPVQMEAPQRVGTILPCDLRLESGALMATPSA